MAVLLPLRIDGKRFFVNPTNISVSKRSQISETRTMAGTVFQVWPDLPDEVTFEGICFGIRSLQELRIMGASIEKAPEKKEVEIVYKHRKYKGYMRDLSLGADAENPRVFTYKFVFVIRNKRFVASDLAIGNLVGIKAEFDFIESQLRGASTAVSSIPTDIVDNVVAVSNSLGRIGLNIGRPRLPSFIQD